MPSNWRKISQLWHNILPKKCQSVFLIVLNVRCPKLSLNKSIMTQPGLKIAATKLFRTSHRIGWENYLKTIVTMDPSPKTIELHAYKIQLNRLATNDHMVQIPLCWKASALLFRHWDDKTKLWWLAFVLMSQCGNIMSLPSSMEDFVPCNRLLQKVC